MSVTPNTPEIEVPQIVDTETAWEEMLAMANAPLTTNDPLMAYALVCIAAELREARLSR